MAFAVRLLLGIALVIGGGVLGFFSVFFILYRGDHPGQHAIVDIGGHLIDARLVGVAGLSVAVAMVVVAGLLMRRRPRVRSSPSH